MSRVACGEGLSDIGNAFWGQRGLLIVHDGEDLGVGAPVRIVRLSAGSRGSISGVSLGFWRVRRARCFGDGPCR